MTAALLLTLPWVGLVLFLLLGVRLPRELPAAGAWHVSAETSESGNRPFVSVIVPARDEAHNIRRVLASLAATDYAPFEIIVVDDRSEDGTGEIARSMDAGNARRLVVLDGERLPDGWFGKQWACAQGARAAEGSVLLFTDADTVHGPALLARAVAALEEDKADAVTVMGRQLMETFWERQVQPHVFMTMILRYPDLSRPLPQRRWRSAIANGQYLTFRREAYEALGGHEAARDTVAEDLRLAQLLVRGGWRFRVRRAEDAFATRMYRSLREMVAGWTKNIIPAGLHTLPPLLRPIAPPLMVLSPLVLWVAPPLFLLAALMDVGGAGPATGIAGAGAMTGAGAVTGGGALVWSAAVVAVSLAFWCSVTRRFGAPWYHGLLYPVGAAVSSYIILRSWLGMRRLEWKGRSYGGRMADAGRAE